MKLAGLLFLLVLVVTTPVDGRARVDADVDNGSMASRLRYVLKDHNKPAILHTNPRYDKRTVSRSLIQLAGDQCQEVEGYIALAGSNNQNDDIGSNCQPAAPASLAAACNQLPWCASFNTDGCLKYKHFNMLDTTKNNCLYVKNTTTPPCPTVAGYDVQQGVDHMGDDIPGFGGFSNVNVEILAQNCSQIPTCTAFNSFGWLKTSGLLNDNDLSPQLCLYTKQVTSSYIALTDGQMCGDAPGFRTYAGGNVDNMYNFPSGCNSQLPRDQVAAKCLATPGCVGFDEFGCLKQRISVTNRTQPTCYWERTDFAPNYCPQVSGYTIIQGADSYGNDLSNTCWSNKTMEENAAACDSNPSCVAFNMIGCLKYGTPRVLDLNDCGPHHCLYVANSLVMSGTPPSSTPSPILQPPPPPRLQPPVPAPPQAGGLDGSNTQQNKKSSVSVGAVAGIIIAVLAAVVAAAMFAMYAWRRGHNRPPPPPVSHPNKENDNISLLKQGYPVMDDIAGLTPGDVFTRSTAFEYTWISSAPPEAVPLQSDDIECRGKPVIELTKQEVKSQLQLVKNGLMGRGATAFVFACVWPSRFGQHRLLAAKVLKDGYDLDVHTLESFTYEATVLASLNPPHRNVVRLFGYCLEPPNVCLVLELLPSSLRTVIHKQPSSIGGSSSNAVTDLKSRGTISATGALPRASVDGAETDGTMYLAYKATTQTAISQSAGFSSTNASSASVSIQVQPQTLGSVMGTSQLSMLQVLQISIDIAAGLKYLHDMPLVVPAQGQGGAINIAITSLSPVGEADGQLQSPALKTTKVVHRDLKPANILIGVDGSAKITDFGLARQQLKTTMVTEHLGAGTLPYMAPELLASIRVGIAGAVTATNRVDIYAMAMIMWEMLAGRMPWGHMAETALIAAVMGGRRPELPISDTNASSAAVTQPLSQIPASLNALPEFNAIIRACWNHREHRRPTAAALHDMLVALRDKYTA